MPRASGSGGEEVEVDLWAMAAELERQFAGYKQRLAERDGTAAREHDDDTGGGGDDEGEAEAGGRSSCSDVRGRMYEAYVRRRDERLREGWHARMERKEAEVKALWAQLELTGRAFAAAERAPGGGGGGDPTATTAAGDEVGNSVTYCHTNKTARFLARGCCHDTLPFSLASFPGRVVF